MEKNRVYTIADHVTLWAEVGGPIHIKIREPHGDPVELGEGEAEELIEALTSLLKEIR